MRAIDADALRDYLQSLAYDDWNQGVGTSWADAYRECADMVDEQPTIKPQRNTGTWLPADTHGWEHQCSECGFSLTFGGDPKTIGYDFCPGCGAQMNGGELDD